MYLNAGTRKVAELDSNSSKTSKEWSSSRSSSSKDMARRFLRMLSHLSWEISCAAESVAHLNTYKYHPRVVSGLTPVHDIDTFKLYKIKLLPWAFIFLCYFSFNYLSASNRFNQFKSTRRKRKQIFSRIFLTVYKRFL